MFGDRALAIQDSEDKVWFGPVGLGVGQAPRRVNVYAIGNPDPDRQPNDRPWEFTVRIFNRQGTAVHERRFRLATGVTGSVDFAIRRGELSARASRPPDVARGDRRLQSAAGSARPVRDDARGLQPGDRTYDLLLGGPDALPAATVVPPGGNSEREPVMSTRTTKVSSLGLSWPLSSARLSFSWRRARRLAPLRPGLREGQRSGARAGRRRRHVRSLRTAVGLDRRRRAHRHHDRRGPDWRTPRRHVPARPRSADPAGVHRLPRRPALRGFNDGPVPIPAESSTTLATLDLPAGSFAIFAKLTILNSFRQRFLPTSTGSAAGLLLETTSTRRSSTSRSVLTRRCRLDPRTRSDSTWSTGSPSPAPSR